jgi:hypothetical protein
MAGSARLPWALAKRVMLPVTLHDGVITRFNNLQLHILGGTQKPDHLGPAPEVSSKQHTFL